MWAEGSASRGCLYRRDRRGWTVGNNVVHYSEALEWPVADWRVFCRIPVAPSTNTGGWKRVPRFFATFTRLSTSGYLVTLVFRAPAPLPADAPHRPLSVKSARGTEGPEETFGGISTACYVASVCGESDVSGCAGLASAAYESESILYGTASRNDPPLFSNDVTL